MSRKARTSPEAPVIVIPFSRRPGQRKLLELLDRKRFVVGVCHRRWGKTVVAVNWLIRKALTCTLPRPRCAYIAPTYRQGKAIAWDYLLHYTAPIPGRHVHESELRVTMPGGAQVRIYGADNPDSLRGLYFDAVVLDEYALMPPTVWEQVIRPAIADRVGQVLWIGTPNGRNHFYEIAQVAKKGGADWAYYESKASESGVLSKEELDRMRLEMPREIYLQEMECAWEHAVRGAIYGHELALAKQEGRITSVPVERVLPVHTAWDLGIGDATAIWFFQLVGNEVHFVDYYEGEGMALDHYVSVLQSKGYAYGRHILPHDAQVRELGTGKSRAEILASLGVRGEIAPNLPVEDGINVTRMAFNRFWFDEKRCEKGIEALMNYRRDYDLKRGELKPKPVHDWSSHGADALRYAAVALDQLRIGRVPKIPAYKRAI